METLGWLFHMWTCEPGWGLGGRAPLSEEAGETFVVLGPERREGAGPSLNWKGKGGVVWEEGEFRFSAQTESRPPSSQPAWQAQGPILEFGWERDPE